MESTTGWFNQNDLHKISIADWIAPITTLTIYVDHLLFENRKKSPKRDGDLELCAVGREEKEDVKNKLILYVNYLIFS